MNFKTVALLHPGNMGATIGAAAATSGARVIWVSRSTQSSHPRTRQTGGTSRRQESHRCSSGERSHSFRLPAGCRSGTRPEGGGAQF